MFYTAVLPRIFFLKYSKLENVKLGFLEHKIPTYAKIFGLRRHKIDLGEMNDTENYEDTPLNAMDKEIPLAYIKSQLKKKGGWRLFHPVTKIYKDF